MRSTTLHVEQATSPPVLLLTEVASLCGVTRDRVIAWCIAEVDPLPHRRIGIKRRVVLPDELSVWAAKRSMLLLGDPAAVARPWPRKGADE